MIPVKIKKISVSRTAATLACAISIYAAVILIVDRATACGPYMSFRAYLQRSFWLPMFYSTNLLLPPGDPGRTAPYAGFSSENAPPALVDLRSAYAPLSIPVSKLESTAPFENAMRITARALAPGVLAGKDLDEARLIDCKISMRHAEWNPNELGAARQKLEQFISSTHNHAFASEARGWLGRIFCLQKDYVRAALIYLDETKADNSPLNRDALVNSLRWAYLADEKQIWDRAEEFFDTPRHALFLVNLATNQRYPHSRQNQYLMERGSKVLALLNSHPSLFKPGADVDALVMALMRTSLFMGDLDATLKYAAAVPKSGALMQNPEFNWMTAIACFIHHDFAAAEAPLQRMLNAPEASSPDRVTAAQALVGVYLKTRQNVEALHASFIQNSQPIKWGQEDWRENWQDIISP